MGGPSNAPNGLTTTEGLLSMIKKREKMNNSALGTTTAKGG